MITLTKSNANERCRTCLCKLIKNENNSLVEVNEMMPFHSRFIDIKSNKELQEMLKRYVYLENETDLLQEDLYPQYICLDCLKHLQKFETFRNKALESTRILLEVFSEELSVHKFEVDDDGFEYKNNLDAQLKGNVKDEDIFNLFLKDSLMETEAVLLGEPDLNNDFDNIDPDPFQSTQKQETNRKKTKVRRGKKKKMDSLTNNESIIRKSKRNDKSLVDNGIHNVENKTEIAKKIYDEEEVSDWYDSTFKDNDDNSSDNEVLSIKVLHSKRIVKERKCRKEVLKSDNEFYIHNIDTEDESKCNKVSEKTNSQTEKQPTDNIKSEHESDGQSSDSDQLICAKTETNIKTIKPEKKKRHCILNSGRKKGLSNRYKCDQCQHKFGHKLTLEAHIRKVHEGQKKAFKCQMCDKAYSFIGGLSTHIRDVHERKQDSYDCSVPGCDKKYSNLMTLQRHVRFKHLNMETTHLYVCEQCGATFKQSSNLRYHMKTRHPTEEDLKRKELTPKERLECEECRKSFHSQYTLKYHKLRVHADEKKFECKICGRRVAKQFMLDSHMLVHSDQKLACKFCGREFVRKYQVEAHIRAVHQKLKPFQCPHCSESFASRKTLRHHIYIHTGEKPYVCDICGQAYRQPTCLKNHRKIHNKLDSNDAATSVAANRNFLNSFVQNNEGTLINSGENLV